MQPFQCDLQAQIPKHPITTHTQAHPKQLEATVTLRQKKTINRPQPHPPHRRGTFHRRLQPLYTEKHKVSCSGFLPKTEPLQHHAPLPFMVAGSLHLHFPSSPLPFLTTSLRHHSPSSSLPFFTASLRHHFPSSPPPFVTTLCHSFLILCDVPPFIKVNSIDSYSFVMYCYVMYCYVMFDPSSRSIP